MHLKPRLCAGFTAMCFQDGMKPIGMAAVYAVAMLSYVSFLFQYWSVMNLPKPASWVSQQSSAGLTLLTVQLHAILC